MKRSEFQIKELIREWVLSHQRKKVTQIDDDTPLLGQRILDSLQIMELILYLEELKGSFIDLGSLKPGSFSTINQIYDAFFREGTHAKAS